MVHVPLEMPQFFVLSMLILKVLNQGVDNLIVEGVGRQRFEKTKILQIIYCKNGYKNAHIALKILPAPLASEKKKFLH